MGKGQGGIFEDWLRNIAILIFTQSFHAIFLVFIMQLMQIVSNSGPQAASVEEYMKTFGYSDAIFSIITIVGMTALLKMEKMIKGMFGMKDSKYNGGIGDNFAKSMAGMKSAASLVGRTAKPVMKTGKLMKEKKLNAKSMLDTLADIDKKKAKVKEIENEAPSGRKKGESKSDYEERKKEYNDKLKKAKDDVAAAEKELEVKKNKDRKLKADIKAGKIESVTTAGSTVAAAAFGIGASANLADAAIIANPTDAILDAISQRSIKNNVYGKASNEQQEYINNLPQNMARRQVRNENPNLAEGSQEFEQKVNLKLNEPEFKRQVEQAVKAAKDTKFEIDMEIPTGKIRQGLDAIADTYDDALHGLSRASRAGRATARRTRREGVTYNGHSVESVDDI